METTPSYIWGKVRLQQKERNTALHRETKEKQVEQTEALINK